MMTSEQILDHIDATPEEREIIHEAVRCIHAERAWERSKAKDPALPRQARYQEPKAADVLRELDMSDRARWIALHEAVKARLEEDRDG